jgi:hypothetical protein
MGWLGRTIVLASVTISNFTLGIIWLQAGVRMVSIARDIMGDGPFSGVVDMVDLIVPLAIAVIQIGIILWFLSAPVQEERARRVQ